MTSQLNEQCVLYMCKEASCDQLAWTPCSQGWCWTVLCFLWTEWAATKWYTLLFQIRRTLLVSRSVIVEWLVECLQTTTWYQFWCPGEWIVYSMVAFVDFVISCRFSMKSYGLHWGPSLWMWNLPQWDKTETGRTCRGGTILGEC